MHHALENYFERKDAANPLDAVRPGAHNASIGFVRRVLRRHREHKPGASTFGDQTPTTIFPILLPGSPHIAIIRDGRDVLVDWTLHLLANGGPTHEPEQWMLFEHTRLFRRDRQYFLNHPDELLNCEPWVRSAARRWTAHVRDHFDALRSWKRGEIDAPIHLVTYEDLCNETTAHRNAMFAFLRIDAAEASPIEQSHETTPERGCEDSLVHNGPARIGEWKRYFENDTAGWFKEVAGEMLIEAGYESSLNW